MTEPIDLKALAGDRYRLELAPGAEDEPRSERGWYTRIAAKYGFIGVHGADALLAHCHAGRIIPRLLAIEGVTVRQLGDGEINVSFPPASLDAVAEVLQARRRRQLCEEQRDRLATAGQRSRFARRTDALPAAPSRD